MNQKLLKQTARLARLHLTEKELQLMNTQLISVFKYFDKIGSFILKESFKPLVDPLDGLRKTSAFRSDEVISFRDYKKLISLSPKVLGDEYLVPPVVE